MNPRFRTITAAGAGITAAAVLAAGLTVAAAAPADAASASSRLGTTSAAVPAAAGWLTTQFVTASTHLPAPSGDHFESKYGKTYYANYGENDDVVFGLAAARSGAAKAAVAQKYLENNVEGYADPKGTDYGPYDGALAKLAVGAQVTGAKPTSFGGYNLLALLKKDECAVGSTTCTPGEAANIYSSISESFVLIAEARAGGSYAPSTAAKTYFASLQCSSGGFTNGTSACGTGAADVDSTSYAIMAMQALGTTGTTLASAVSWLRGQQNAKGYWTSQGIANTNSTGLAVAALQGVGASYGKGRSWLLAQQQRSGAGAGALTYGGTVTGTTTSATSPSVLATAQALLGLVNGSSLATLTAKGSTAGAKVFAPVAHAVYRQKRRSAQRVSATGFAAGEKVRVSLGSKTIKTVVAGALGGCHVTARPSSTGYTAYTFRGLSSGLSATHHVHVTR